jgi:hypothetical protein
MSGWTPLTNQPAFQAGTMLLLTDGAVLCQDEGPSNGGTANWWKLTPDAFGSYVNGGWSKLASGPNAPLYYASAVLRDGRVFVAGGEYNAGASVDLLAAEIYDPVADTWTTLATPPGWTNIGDAPCCVLPDGRLLLGAIKTKETAIYDPQTNSWTAAPNKDDVSEEETWTLLPDHTVLVAECTSHPKAEKYVPSTNQWVSAGSVPAAADLVQSSAASSDEIGPAILLPDGRVFAVGASGHTALYTPPHVPTHPGHWHAGPDFPKSGGKLMQAFDAPAVLLPDGKVLCIAGPQEASGWAGPCNFFEYDGTDLDPAPNPPTANVDTWQTRLLLLPTGEVLFSNGSSNIQVYQPNGHPHHTWRPDITSCPTHLQPGHSYKLHGRKLNGLSQANSYGDDAAMATNYPLVRIHNRNTGHVFFCRTHSHSTMAVATGMAIHSTHFDVPAGIELGAAELCVIANGIPSECVRVHLSNKPWKDHDFDEEFEKEDVEVKLSVRMKESASGAFELKFRKDDEEHRNGDWDEFQKMIRLLAERTERFEQIFKKRGFVLEEDFHAVEEGALVKTGKHGKN